MAVHITIDASLLPQAECFLSILKSFKVFSTTEELFNVQALVLDLNEHNLEKRIADFSAILKFNASSLVETIISASLQKRNVLYGTLLARYARDIFRPIYIIF